MKYIFLILSFLFLSCTEYTHENIIEVTYTNNKVDTLFHVLKTNSSNNLEYEIAKDPTTKKLSLKYGSNCNATYITNIKDYEILETFVFKTENFDHYSEDEFIEKYER